MGSIGPVQLLIVAVIIVLLFGTKKLRNLGGDLGAAVKGFKNSIADDNAEKDKDVTENIIDKSTADNEKVTTKEKDQA